MIGAWVVTDCEGIIIPARSAIAIIIPTLISKLWVSVSYYSIHS